MKYRSVFDVIGPVMIGPSSSHTAGAVRIGRLARKLFGKVPDKVIIHFYGSFAQTYQGHATDVASLAGVMGFATDDYRIPNAINIAAKEGIDCSFIAEKAVPTHPNTVMIELSSGEERSKLVGISIGGGVVSIVELDGFDLKLSGESPALLIFHKDIYGAIAQVTQILARYQVNISHMEVSRQDRGCTALMVIETDQKVSKEIIDRIVSKEHIIKVISLED